MIYFVPLWLYSLDIWTALWLVFLSTQKITNLSLFVCCFITIFHIDIFRPTKNYHHHIFARGRTVSMLWALSTLPSYPRLSIRPTMYGRGDLSLLFSPKKHLLSTVPFFNFKTKKHLKNNTLLCVKLSMQIFQKPFSFQRFEKSPTFSFLYFFCRFFTAPFFFTYTNVLSIFTPSVFL